MKKIIALMGLFGLSASVLAGERPTIDKFFGGQRIDDVSISPDGRYLALRVTGDGVHYVAISDRQQKTAPKPVMQLDLNEHASFRWCHWAKNDRLLCSVTLTTNKYQHRFNDGSGVDKYFPATRLVAFDADGNNNKTLVQKFSAGAEQFQDSIIDWLPDDPDNVLIELLDNGIAVYKLNIRTGSISKYDENSALYVAGFSTDGKGNVRLASGIYETTLHMYAREKGSKIWKEIVKREIELTSENHHLEPESVIPDTNEAYATGDYNGYNALWSVSLTGQSEPQMLFAQPGADVHPIYAVDQALLGVEYEGTKPGVKYFNQQAEKLQSVADKLLPDHLNQLVSFSRDLKVAVVKSQSDRDPPYYYVVDVNTQPVRFERIGSSHPALKGYELARTELVNFAAADGTSVPGYLTRPYGVEDLSKAPLIVLPHGGPYARDYWGFDSWVQVLAARGYVVLQVEFRGSTGFGNNWYTAGFADWSGKPYSDVIDGTKWALSNNYGDAARTCIVGASFGGYMALLSATRNPETKLFKCSVSIAGVSDLRQLSKDIGWYGGKKLNRQSIGTDSGKLKEDSPDTHAKEINIPVMLIHGDHDYTVDVVETTLMDQALKKADKAHEVVIIEGADHYFRDDAYLRQMFVAMDGFLAKYLTATN